MILMWYQLQILNCVPTSVGILSLTGGSVFNYLQATYGYAGALECGIVQIDLLLIFGHAKTGDPWTCWFIDILS